MSHKIILRVPRQTAAQPGDLDFHPKAFKSWAENLPLANISETTQQILKALHQLNRRVIKEAYRYEVMAILLPLVDEAFKTLNMPHQREAFPLTKKSLAVTDLLQQILTEMAFAYKAIILDLLCQPKNRSKEHLYHATLHAISQLGSLLSEHYQTYSEEPKGVWLELHQLYQLAAKHKFSTIPLAYSGIAEASTQTVENAYKRILLLALANPYHVMQGEGAQIYQLLGKWASYSRIVPVDKITKAGLVVDCAKDAAPRFISPENSEIKPGNGLLLNIAELVKLIRIQIQKMSARNKLGEEIRTTLAERARLGMFLRLARAWGVRSERLSTREARSTEISAVVGLSACHHIVSNEEEFRPEEDEVTLSRKALGLSSTSANALSLLPQDHSPWLEDNLSERIATGINRPRVSRFDRDSGADIWEQIHATKIREESLKEQEGPSKPTMLIATCQQYNQSRGGLAITCSPDSGVRARVGELIAEKINDGDTLNEWKIGTVRWLKASPNQDLEIGITTLSEDARSVAIKAVSGAGQGGEYFRALLIPNLNPREFPCTLLAPAAVYDINSVLMINLKDDIIHVRLTHLIESSALYSRFRFELVSAPKIAGPAAGNPRKSM
ncbi:MAG: hypothetical protein GXP10_00275 [Gammaproteobacteria bacterium]|nr:hypothetical protein [Gammaproteobacteria bacterium]